MKRIGKIILICALTASCSTSKLDSSHVLCHPKLKVQTHPTGTWIKGWIYHTDVMEYLAGTYAERQRATAILESAGFCRGKTDYIFFSKKGPIVVDNKVFKSKEEAVEFIKKQHLTRVLYCDGSIFPKDLPNGLRVDGVDFWLLDWKK
ncbi:MAG: hypothetical protein PHR77_20405 [Kiritimatiellae bacterium]|nr:hypothetical protein [Kiritimatiellia bacterium]MDD5521195.1 hypothetical protein [Kiritimatiellia bacterium]